MPEYYDGQKLLSYNRVIHMCIGERGIGKSYYFKDYPIRKFLKEGKKFIYLRRYKTELRKVKRYFEDIKDEYPDHEFTVKGWEFYCDGKLMGFAVPLSTWQSEKSTAYPDFDTIIFDEFIREKDKSGYLPDEVNAFLNFCHTVFRRREGVRAFCLSNSITEVNPYFLEFNIRLEKDKRFNFSADPKFRGYVVCENTDGFYQTKEEERSPFEEMISHLEYGRMALDNEFINDTDTFLKKRSKESKFEFSLIYNDVTYGVWVDTTEGLLYLSKKHDPSTKRVYPLTVGDHNENLYYMHNWKDIHHLRKLAKAFEKGYLRFESQQVKAVAFDIFKKMRIC